MVKLRALFTSLLLQRQKTKNRKDNKQDQHDTAAIITIPVELMFHILPYINGRQDFINCLVAYPLIAQHHSFKLLLFPPWPSHQKCQIDEIRKLIFSKDFIICTNDNNDNYYHNMLHAISSRKGSCHQIMQIKQQQPMDNEDDYDHDNNNNNNNFISISSIASHPQTNLVLVGTVGTSFLYFWDPVKNEVTIKNDIALDHNNDNNDNIRLSGQVAWSSSLSSFDDDDDDSSLIACSTAGDHPSIQIWKYYNSPSSIKKYNKNLSAQLFGVEVSDVEQMEFFMCNSSPHLAVTYVQEIEIRMGADDDDDVSIYIDRAYLVAVWNIHTGTCEILVNHKSQSIWGPFRYFGITCLGTSKQSAHLAMATGHTLNVWKYDLDTTSRNKPIAFDINIPEPVTSLIFDPNCNKCTILLGTRAGYIHSYTLYQHPREGNWMMIPLQSLYGHDDAVIGNSWESSSVLNLAFSSNGKTLASGSRKQLRVWDYPFLIQQQQQASNC